MMIVLHNVLLPMMREFNCYSGCVYAGDINAMVQCQNKCPLVSSGQKDFSCKQNCRHQCLVKCAPGDAQCANSCPNPMF